MYMAGDVKGSREMEFYLNEMNHALMSEVNPIPVKTAMRLMGMEHWAALRLPLTEMQGERLDELQSRAPQICAYREWTQRPASDAFRAAGRFLIRRSLYLSGALR